MLYDTDKNYAVTHYAGLAHYAMRRLSDLHEEYKQILNSIESIIWCEHGTGYCVILKAEWTKDALDISLNPKKHTQQLRTTPLCRACTTPEEADRAVISLKSQCELMQTAMQQKRTKS
ncbi:hypothetical protein QDX21_03350 [Auritidibacter ignavus]|uniref:Uncharacterized protein n=1 Tax=Auritidibacter ignavus TaxID=678932 RepID=A0AAJ6AJJ1_9MICC|nr:hypothetical protein [Auritidibacter ignavus]WGH91423.1 hypothetical protein QDX23_03390 [Auritidibacter ignavus]WGH93847.1 hypothetical protein QDX21_03350 [Auritidibacter ignavus]